jgi:hypothetical protein
MTDAITSSISTLIRAVVDGASAVYGAIKAVEKANEGLEGMRFDGNGSSAWSI